MCVYNNLQCFVFQCLNADRLLIVVGYLNPKSDKKNILSISK